MPMRLRRVVSPLATIGCVLQANWLFAESNDILPPTKERVAGGAIGGDGARFSGELGQQVERLHRTWGELGQASALPPTIMERGDQADLLLPSAALDPETTHCTTLAVLSAPNISFVVTFGDGGLPMTQRAWPVPSTAGVAELTRCGARKRLLGQLQVQMRSRRGVIESVLVSSHEPPPAASEVLQGRDPGPSRPAPQVGPRPYLLPISQRLENRQRSLLRAGAVDVVQSSIKSDEAGRGSRAFHLADGCHRFLALAPRDESSPPDLDARLVELARGELLDRDEEQAGEASLLHCTGQNERVRLDFNGANPGSEVVVIHARYDLPNGIPMHWGSDARGQFAQVLREDDLPSPPAPPILSALGVRGETRFRIETKPMRCYLAAAAPIRGESRRIQIRAFGGTMDRYSQSLGDGEGAALSLCPGAAEHMVFQVHSVGTAVAWVFSIWELGDLSSPADLGDAQ